MMVRAAQRIGKLNQNRWPPRFVMKCLSLRSVFLGVPSWSEHFEPSHFPTLATSLHASATRWTSMLMISREKEGKWDFVFDCCPSAWNLVDHRLCTERDREFLDKKWNHSEIKKKACNKSDNFLVSISRFNRFPARFNSIMRPDSVAACWWGCGAVWWDKKKQENYARQQQKTQQQQNIRESRRLDGQTKVIKSEWKSEIRYKTSIIIIVSKSLVVLFL